MGSGKSTIAQLLMRLYDPQDDFVGIYHLDMRLSLVEVWVWD